MYSILSTNTLTPDMVINRPHVTNCPSDDPFSNVNIIKEKQMDGNEIKDDKKFDDSIFFAQLLKNKVETTKNDEDRIKKNIYRRVKIISEQELKGKTMEYFKFPFNADIRNDNSKLFDLIYMEWLIAITSAFKNYRNNKAEFYVRFLDHVFIFSDILYCSTEFKNTLLHNEISYVEETQFLKVSGIDISMVYDYIVNYKLKLNEAVPFILSKCKFINSINYESKFTKTLMVKDRGVLKYYYVIEGYFYGSDFSEYFEKDIVVEF